MLNPRAPRPAVSIVVVHYRQQRQLDLVLAALDVQAPSSEAGFEVVVSDDGSPQPPQTGEHPYPVRVVRQVDLGFRAAAARNRGAAAAAGDVLLFLDADTVPAPGYVASLAAACADEVTLAVGRRRHADLSGWNAEQTRAWLGSGGPGPPELPEPGWLREAYATTDDLARVDDGGFRFVISAVLAIPRRLWEAVGGFDETFTGYGGEDWDLAHRAVVAGARLRHVPDAVAWHDGPDLAGRGLDLARAKNAETAHLARRVPHPAVRPRGLRYGVPEAVLLASVSDWELGQGLLSLAGLLDGCDAGAWLTGAGEELRQATYEDPRVQHGAVPAEVLARARFLVQVSAPVVPVGPSLTELLRSMPPDPGPPDPSDDARMPGGLLAWRTRWLGAARLRGLPDPAPWSPPGGRLTLAPPDAVAEWWRPATGDDNR